MANLLLLAVLAGLGGKVDCLRLRCLITAISVAASNLDLAYNRLWNRALEVDMQQSIIHISTNHLYALSQDKAALELA